MGLIKIKPVKIKIKHLNDKRAEGVKMTHLRHAQANQPCGYPSIHAYGVIGPRCQCGHIKSASRNFSQMWNSRRTYLRCVNVLPSFWRPRKHRRRLNELNFKSRMLGEPWHDVEDHRWSLCMLQSTEDSQCDTTFKSGHMMWKSCKVMQTFATTSFKFNLDWTH